MWISGLVRCARLGVESIQEVLDQVPEIVETQMPYRANKPAPHLPEATILVELDGKIIGQYRLNKQLLTIGRLSSNDIAISNQSISRLHAKLYMEGKDWIIEDAESINGIVYKGQRVERVHLTHGDRVFIAPTVSLTYQAGS